MMVVMLEKIVKAFTCSVLVSVIKFEQHCINEIPFYTKNVGRILFSAELDAANGANAISAELVLINTYQSTGQPTAD